MLRDITLIIVITVSLFFVKAFLDKPCRNSNFSAVNCQYSLGYASIASIIASTSLPIAADFSSASSSEVPFTP